MGVLSGLSWPTILAFANLILSAAITITAFSLLGYMIMRNLRSPVAQSFNVLLTCVLIVVAGDIVVPRVESLGAAGLWLRFQWIGIALVPAAYLHFSDAVLRTTHHVSPRRRTWVIASYIFSIFLIGVALFTDLLVMGAVYTPPVSHLTAGPLFPVFVLYFFATGTFGAFNVYRARKRALTPATRRRMTYLTISLAAPALGVFPFLVSLGFQIHESSSWIILLSMAANVAVGTMLVVMAYSVAYYGVLTPDRVVKHDLIHYLLRGPVVGTLVIIVMLVMPRVELILGLPRDTALIFAVVGVIVIGELAVNLGKPWIDRLIYSQDQEEISWIQTLEGRLLTSSDLAQFLENVLAGLCELLRVDTGFVLVQTDGGLKIEAGIGQLELARWYAESSEARATWDGFAESNGRNGRIKGETPHFRDGEDFWLCPLRAADGENLLGLLAVAARNPEVDLTPTEEAEAENLLAQAKAALSDRYVQEGVFATLQQILPDLTRIQEWRSALRFATPASAEPAAEPDAEIAAGSGAWQQWVKDALSHYWGGPKLTSSPLLGLTLVRDRLGEHNGNAARAMRAVLQEAIDRLRPPGERKLTASEWLLYNILDLRFVQGQRVRDIAGKLAISESDLYRKQRVAVAEVARTLEEMEKQATGETGEDLGSSQPVQTTG